jgi:hypothetical protein
MLNFFLFCDKKIDIPRQLADINRFKAIKNPKKFYNNHI